MVLSLLALLFTIAVVREVQDVGICHTSISNSYMDFFPEGKWDGIEDFLRWNQVCKIATCLLVSFHFHSIRNNFSLEEKKWAKLYICHLEKIKRGASLLSADLHDNSPFHTLHLQKVGKARDKFPWLLDSDVSFPSEDPTGTTKFSAVVGEKMKWGIWKTLEVLAGGEFVSLLGCSFWKRFTLTILVL